MLSSRDLPDSGIEPASLMSPALVGEFFTTNATWEAIINYAAPAAKSLQSCLTLCDPIDGSASGSTVPGILQARILEWVAMLSSRDLPNPGMEPRSPCRQLLDHLNHHC